MTSTKSQSKTVQNSMKMQTESHSRLSFMRKDSVPNSQLICQNHSSTSIKQFMKFININYFQPKQRKKNLPIKVPFLCDVCLSEMKNKRNTKQALQYVKSLQQFQTEYIESVFRMYEQEKDLYKKIQLIQHTEKMFNQEIDRITQTFNKALQNYKNKFSGIFNSIIEPFNKKSFLKFRKGEFNEEIIRELYTSSKQVETYSSLIGQNNQESLKYTCEGLKNSLEELQKLMKNKLWESQFLLKSVIKIYKKPQLIDQLKNINTDPQNNAQRQGHIWQRIKMMKQERKRKLSRKKQIRMRSVSQNRQKNSSQQQQKQQQKVLQSQRKKIPIQQTSNFPKKHKIIRRQRLEKPSRRSDVHVIGQRILLRENKMVVLYMVNKTHTEKLESQTVNRLPSEEFKRKYPIAYRDFQKDELLKREKN